MSRIKSLLFFIIAQDYFQLTPLWKPQILLKQVYSFFITARFATLRTKPFDFLVFFYLFISVVLLLTQLIQYSVLSHQYGFFDLFSAQYPLLMAFSVLTLYGPVENMPVRLFVRVVGVFVWLNIFLNVLIAVTGLEERLAAGYDIFEYSFNQNIVVFFLFFQAVAFFRQTERMAKARQGLLLLGLLCLVNVPNFQRARFIVILLVLFVFFLHRATPKIKGLLIGVCAVAALLLFKTEKFSTVLEALSSKEEALDPSLAGRFIQVQRILTTDFNPVYGFGFMGAKTKELFFDEDYFHPNDTGLFGVYFNGGFLGLLLFALLFAIAIREVVRHSRAQSGNGLDVQRKNLKLAAVLMICFILVSSFFTASLFYDPVFLISYLHLLKRF